MIPFPCVTVPGSIERLGFLRHPSPPSHPLTVDPTGRRLPPQRNTPATALRDYEVIM